MSEFSELCAFELMEARLKFPAGFHSGHEAYGVILEELDEFWDEVKRQHPNPVLLLKELIQVAAMCERAAEDLGLLEIEVLNGSQSNAV